MATIEHNGGIMNKILIKLSGKCIESFLNEEYWIDFIKSEMKKGNKVIIAHGAGKMITDWANKMGLESNFYKGQRITDDKMMEIVAAVQGGIYNAKIIARLNSCEISAIGLSGIDGNSFVASYVDSNLGYVGKPEISGDFKWLECLIEKNIVPVFSSVCRDKDGNLMNVNADVFANALAQALKIDCVYFFSDVSAVIIDGQPKSKIAPQEIYQGINNGSITDGMIPKLLSCVELLEKGVEKIWIGSIIKKEVENEYSSPNGTWIVHSN